MICLFGFLILTLLRHLSLLMRVWSRVHCLYPHSYAAMAAKWKEPPRDALDTLVLGAVDMPSMVGVEQTDFMPFDPTVKVLGDQKKT